MPSIRIDQSDLKCKNGCEYFGNPHWQGYCSKCYRERQNRAEKASSSTLPRSDQKKPEKGLKLATHSSFSKFEEKRLRQSETLKKANLLKFSVFKKSTTDDADTVERRPPEFKVPPAINENMKREFRVRFPILSTTLGRELRAFVHHFIMDVIKCSNVMTVDDLSERVQRHYQQFMKKMDASPHLADVEQEVKEQLIDFVEKHAMTYLHDLPGVVFSPQGTEDERQDRTMSERIQQLSWLRETHLDCKIRATQETSDLLYRAISELLAMDGAASPGGKLARVRRACRHVLRLCAAHAPAPASADDLLPAVIFTVLKANPPRLVSNINFVTRFCNAQRLMTGEGGYYFTNLCCAVSFIENLNAESLSMDKKEFECYMAMPASIGGSTWAAALSLCGAVREAEEQKQKVEKLMEDVNTLQTEAAQLSSNAETFEKEIVKKVQDVLAKTPLEIKPRRELPRHGTAQNIAALIEIDTPEVEKPERIPKIELPEVPEVTEPIEQMLLFEEKPSPPKSPQSHWEPQTGSFELLTPSPLGFTSFDSRSIDELVTPEDFGTDHLMPGLSNINYDIDLSDLSGDNSFAEDTKEPKDPFSPDALKNFEPFPHTSKGKTLHKFNELSLIDSKTQETKTFEIVQRSEERDPPFSPAQKETFILDDSGSPSAECFLPSPLTPQTGKKV